jgi:hypothetical protein
LNAEESLIVDAEIRDVIFSTRQKSKDASTDAGRVSPYSKAVERLIKFFDDVEDVSPLEECIINLRHERDQVRVKNSLRKADIWLAKAKEAKAIEVLAEAIVELKHDATPDLEQADLFAKLNARIEELSLKNSDSNP